MSAGITLRTTAGGSVTLIGADDLTTDETFELSGSGFVGTENGGSGAESWVKFFDGTAIVCGESITDANGLAQVTPAIPLVDSVISPVLTVSVIADYTVTNDALAIVQRYTTADNFFKVRSINPNSGGSSVGNVSFQWQLIGRWK